MPNNKLPDIEAARGELETVIPALLQKYDGSQRAVAEELEVSPATVSLWLKHNGYVQRRIWVKETKS